MFQKPVKNNILQNTCKNKCFNIYTYENKVLDALDTLLISHFLKCAKTSNSMLVVEYHHSINQIQEQFLCLKTKKIYLSVKGFLSSQKILVIDLKLLVKLDRVKNMSYHCIFRF